MIESDENRRHHQSRIHRHPRPRHFLSDGSSVPAHRCKLCQQDRQHVAGDPERSTDFKPHEKVNTIRATLVHQLFSERRSFAQLVGTEMYLYSRDTPGT